MKRLNAKQLLSLSKDKYHDGNGLYISFSSLGRGKWSFRYTINKKSREMGLGSFPDVSLLEARQYALHNKQLLGIKLRFYVNSKIRNSPILLISIYQQKRKMNGLILKANNNGEIQFLPTHLLFWIGNHLLI